MDGVIALLSVRVFCISLSCLCSPSRVNHKKLHIKESEEECVKQIQIWYQQRQMVWMAYAKEVYKGNLFDHKQFECYWIYMYECALYNEMRSRQKRWSVGNELCLRNETTYVMIIPWISHVKTLYEQHGWAIFCILEVNVLVFSLIIGMLSRYEMYKRLYTNNSFKPL